jgi:hypothetical protein
MRCCRPCRIGVCPNGSGVDIVKKSELLDAIQNEIQRHNLSTFMSKEHKIVQTGCSVCQRYFGTVEQFKRHLSEDVLPQSTFATAI